MAVNVGKFVKKADGTGTQTVAHGLGMTPKAIIFTMSRGLSLDTYASNAFLCQGITDGTDSFSVAWASDGAAATSNASSGRRADPLHAVLWGETTVVVGEFDSWDGTNFVIDWTTNNAEAWNIGFIAIGGDDVDAKVLTWATGTGTANIGITGAGFQPSTALHIHDGRQSTSVPSVGADAHIGIGAVDSTGASGQWWMYGRSSDNAPASVAQSRTDLDGMLWKSNAVGTEDGKASHVSWDSDGETIDMITATSSSMTVGVLFLAGIQTDAYTFAKSTNTSVPVAQSNAIDIVALALFSVTDCKVDSGTDILDGRVAIGMSDGTDEIAFQVQDITNEDPTKAFDFVNTSKGLVLSRNDTPTTTAAADISFSGTDVVYTWTTNNAEAALIRGLAFGSEISSGSITGVAATATAAALAGTLGAGNTVTITGVIATATAAALPGTIASALDPGSQPEGTCDEPVLEWILEADFDQDTSFTDIILSTRTGVGSQITITFNENEASQMVLTLANRSGEYSPRNSAGTYFPYAGDEGIPIRLRVSIDEEAAVTVWNGYIMDWEWIGEGLNTARLTIRCGDILALKADDIVSVNHATTYDVDGAFGAVFAAMGLAGSEYDVSADSPQPLPHFWAVKEAAGRVWAGLLSAEMGGALYCPPNGKATFRPRDYFLGVDDPTYWGDDTCVEPIKWHESRPRGELVTKVDTSISPITIGAGGVVVWRRIQSFVDVATGANISKELAPNEEWGPLQIFPYLQGITGIDGTPVVTSGIDFVANSNNTGTGTDRTAEITVTVIPDPNATWAVRVKNTSAVNTSYLGLLQARSVSLSDDGSAVQGSSQKLTPTGGTDASAGAVAWGSAGNVSASDDAAASVTLTGGQTSQYLTAKAWGYGIPSTANVSGILFEAELAGAVETTQAVSLRAIKGGTILTTTTKSQVVNTVDAYYGFGGASELWGTDWTPADINDPTFGCAIFVSGALADTYTCDHVKATVYYTVPGGVTASRRVFTQSLDIPNLKVARGRQLGIQWVDDDNLARDFGHSELMKGRYPKEEIELQFAHKNDATVREMVALEYGQLKRYRDTDLGAQGCYTDDWYRVVSYTHNITIGAVSFTTVRLRPAHLWHNIDSVTWDGFDRSDSATLDTTPTGDTWAIISGTWAIEDNHAINTLADGGFSEIEYDANATDVKVLLQWSNLADTAAFSHTQQLRYRKVDASNYWYIQRNLNSEVIRIVRVTGGIGAVMGSIALDPEDTDMELRLIVQYSRHRVWLDRRLIFDLVDATNGTGTKVAFAEQVFDGEQAHWDNISVIALS